MCVKGSRTDPLWRFWKKVQKTESCWLWIGAISGGTGYGSFMNRDQIHLGAHRFAYEALVGTIPSGMTIDHLCRVRRCVNPAHLEAVPIAENLRRARPILTHCPHGHAYTENNLRSVAEGQGRKCLTCHREWEYERRQRAS